MTISLAFLASDLVKAAIEGRLPHGMGVTRLADLPAEWSRQRQMLGLPCNSSPFEPSLRRHRSLLPGNGISIPEKKGANASHKHRSAVSETERSCKNPANAGPLQTPTGIRRKP
jgi:hypothetical protein